MLALICALLAAGLAGYSRGFAAFGTAMIYIPLVTLAYDAKTAVVTLILVDLAPSLPLLWKAAPRCDRRTVLWMVAGAIALSPVGVAVLLVADQAHSQFALGAILLAAVSYMVLRPDFRIRTTPINSVGAGAVSGFAGGICGMFGPPAMVYLIGRSENPLDSRADMIVYLSSESIVLGITYFLYDMYTAWYFELSVILAPIYGIATWCGARQASHTSETSYRRIILGLLWAVSALLVAKAIFPLSA